MSSSVAQLPPASLNVTQPPVGWEPFRHLASTPWLLIHAGVLLALGFLWNLDEPLFHLANGFYNGGVQFNGELHQLILSLKQYGQLLGIATALILIYLFDVHRRGRVAVLALMIVAAGLSSGLMKTAVGRTRPLEAEGKTIIQGPTQGFAASRSQSFPSGHTATAFALSYGLSHFYPAGKIFFWGLAGGVALNRWITVLHFPSDVLMGAWLGVVAAVFVAYMRSVKQLESKIDHLLAPGRAKTSPSGTLDLRSSLRQVVASPWLLLVVSLAIHWAGNGATPLWDRDEPRFATATREMASRGDWIVPTFNGELRPDKPILIYWLMRGAYAVFGDGTFAARYVSGLAGTLACLVVLQLGTRMFDRRVGLLAGWMLALSPMLIAESKLATVDALLLFFLSLCFLAWWSIVEGRSSARYWVLFWGALGFAILTKGPVAVGVLAASMVPFAFLDRDRSWLARMAWFKGLTLVAFMVLPWCAAVQWATDGEFLMRAIGHHVVRRSVVPLENHRGFPGYYAVLLFGLMAPWAWLLPWSIGRHWKRLWADRRLVFLATWALGNLVLFECVRTKLVHYYLPAYPALLLLIASAAVGRFEHQTLGVRHLDRRLAPLMAVVGCLLALIAVIFAGVALPMEAAIPTALVALTLGGGIAFAGTLLRRRKLRYAFAVVAASMASAFFLAGSQLFPRLGEQRVIVKVAQRLREIQENEKIALWHYCDPSLIYNFGQPIEAIDSLRNDPIFPESLELAQKYGKFICPMKQEQMELMAKDPNLQLDILESITSFDLHGMRPRTIHLVAVSAADSVMAESSQDDPNCTACKRLVKPYMGQTQAASDVPERR